MSGPLPESLSKFTPHAGRLNRDALLFAAGQRSARPNRVWQGLTVVLAASQLLTLICIWPHPMELGPGAADVMARHSTLAQPVEQHLLEPDQQHIWSARHVPNELMLEHCAAKGIVTVGGEPELRAFGLPPDSMLN